MHPLLAHRGRLGLYLIGWLPLLPLVVGLLVVVGGGGRGGDASWGEGLAVGLPLLAFYAYLGLAAFYVCRVLPVGETDTVYLLGVHLVSAVLSAGFWVLVGQGWAWCLGRSGLFPRAAEHFARALPALFGAGVPLYLAAVVLHYLVLAVEASRDAERRALAAKVLAREAELKALKAQLDPHFLFNSLNAVAALAGSDPAAARKMAILLAEFLRRSLALAGQAAIPLGEELAYAASYLAVERVRFGERLAVVETIDAASRACPVPPLLLQPLVENAVRHGIAQLLDGGVIGIEARLAGGRLALAVENPCDPDHAPPPAPTAGGVGLANVAERLAARYGREADLAVRTAGGRFRVEITLPADGSGGARG